MAQQTEFPKIRTDREFKDRVFEACKTLNLKYSVVVKRLLERWLAGEIELEMKLDKKFIEAVKAAVNSPEGQTALQELGNAYDPKREYPEAKPL